MLETERSQSRKLEKLGEGSFRTPVMGAEDCDKRMRPRESSVWTWSSNRLVVLDFDWNLQINGDQCNQLAFVWFFVFCFSEF